MLFRVYFEFGLHFCRGISTFFFVKNSGFFFGWGFCLLHFFVFIIKGLRPKGFLTTHSALPPVRAQGPKGLGQAKV